MNKNIYQIRHVILILIISGIGESVDVKRRKYLHCCTRKSHYFTVIRLPATTYQGKQMVGERMAPAPTLNLQLTDICFSLATGPGLPPDGGHIEVTIQIMGLNIIKGEIWNIFTVINHKMTTICQQRLRKHVEFK